MARALGIARLSRVALVLLLAAPASAQQVALRRPVEVGTRSSARGTLELQLKLDYTTEGVGVFQSEERAVEAQVLVHELVTAVHGDGRPARVVRTYEQLDVRYRNQGGTGAVLDDPRTHNVVELALDAAGRRRVLRAADASDPALVQMLEQEVETDLLPPGPVAVGASWDAPRIGLPAPVEAGARGEGVRLRVTLAGLERDDEGRQLALLRLEGSGTYRADLTNDQGEAVQRCTTRVEYGGQARVELASGRLIDQRVEGRFQRREELVGSYVAAGEGCWTEGGEVAYGRVRDGGGVAAPAPTGPAPAPRVDGRFGTAHGRVAAGQLVVERDDGRSGARLVLLDPAAGQQGPTLLHLPPEASIDHAALSPGRDRVAFSSQLNSAISIASWNLFVLDTTTGQVDQVSPGWASGRGLATAAEGQGTGTIVGRLEWIDEQDRRRTDGILGSARVERSTCRAPVAGDGTFRIEGVPAGGALVHVRATVPRRLAPGQLPTGDQVVMTVVVPAGGTADTGLLRLTPPAVDVIHSDATWSPQGLLARLNGLDRLVEVGYPERRFRDDLELGGAGLVHGPGGRLATFEGDDGLALLDPATRAVRGRVRIPRFQGDASQPVPSLFVTHHFDPSTRGVWLPDGEVLVVGGTIATPKGVWPALLGVNAAGGQVFVARAWPEWALDGRRIVDVAVNDEGTVAYLVVHTGEGERTRGDLWAWDAPADSTVRLTDMGDVVGVTNGGR